MVRAADPSPAPLAHAIAAQPLQQALNAFAQDAQLQLIYVSSLAEGKRSPGASAGSTPTTALAQLLTGSGLSFEFLNARLVKIFATPAIQVAAGAKQAAAPVEAPAATPSTPPLDEVLVTATKRELPLGLVPLSVSVLTGDDLQQQHAHNIGDLAALSPGLHFDFNSEFGPELLTNIMIRGLSTANGGPLVGVYMDDVPIQATLNAFRNAYPMTFDLEQVEVLRGPQGTLYGSNSPTGAIRFVTKTPSTTQFSAFASSDLEATQGGGLSTEQGLAAGGPLIPGVLGVRASVWYRDEGGYVDRVDPLNGAMVDPNANRSISKMARVGLSYQPNESLQITPTFTYQNIQLHDSPSFFVGLSDPGADILHSGRLLQQPHSDVFMLTTLKLEQDFGAARLTSVSSYFDRVSSALNDETNDACLNFLGSCGNPQGPAYPSSYDQAVPSQLTEHQSEMTQEVRLASTRSDARLSWLAGVFFERDHQNGGVDTYSVLTPQDPGIFSMKYFYGEQLSLFGQLDLALTPRWRIGVGTRVGWNRGDSSDFEGGYANTGVAPASYAIGRINAVPDAPRIELTYQMNPDEFMYASVSKGSRNGGHNSVASCGTENVPSAYGTEAIWNYEVGAKSQLWEHRLQLSNSVYYIRWNSIQESVDDLCGDSYTTNAEVAAGTGFESSVQALLSPRWRVDASVAMTNVHYRNTVLTGDGQIVVAQGTAVGELPAVAAPWTGSLSVRYQYPLRANTTVYAAGEDLFSSHNPGPFTEQYPNAVNYSPGLQSDPAINRINLRVGLMRDSWDAHLSVDNMFNTLPTLQTNNDGIGSTLEYAYTVRPRTVALTAERRF